MCFNGMVLGIFSIFFNYKSIKITNCYKKTWFITNYINNTDISPKK